MSDSTASTTEAELAAIVDQRREFLRTYSEDKEMKVGFHLFAGQVFLGHHESLMSVCAALAFLPKELDPWLRIVRESELDEILPPGALFHEC